MSKRLLLAATLIALANPALAEMRLTSPDIAEGKPLGAAQVLNGFGCSGGNQAPALAWSGAPAATKSYVVMLRDPDAPTGSGFWHWVAFNIPVTTTGLPAGGGAPAGMVLARNDFSQNAYAGACPPPGAPHRYVFTVFAMPDATLPLDATASAALVGFFAETGSLARATITATYGR
jgi:Raf kinase inhibitor-like YbhB/YbcL family protein